MASDRPLLLLLNCDAEAAVRQVAQCIANDPLIHIYNDSPANGPIWRVIYKGMTFGLEVGKESAEVAGYERVFCLAEPSSANSMLSIGLDANLAGGEKTAPIAAALLEIGGYLVQHLAPSMIAWTPGKIATDPAYFSEAVTDYVNGGAFPALAVVHFAFSDANDAVRTTGLTWFSGQELELKGDGLSKADLARRAVRLIHDIAVNGPISGEEVVPDVATDRRLVLSPSEDGTLVVGQICSDMDLVRHK